MIRTPIQTRWNDMDPMGHVNNAGYVSYLEAGRIHYFVENFNSQKIEDIPFILVRIEIDIKVPITMNDKVEVVTRVGKIGRASWEFECTIQSTNGNKIFAYAKTVQVSYDYKLQKSVPIPDSIRKVLEADRMKFLGQV